MGVKCNRSTPTSPLCFSPLLPPGRKKISGHRDSAAPVEQKNPITNHVFRRVSHHAEVAPVEQQNNDGDGRACVSNMACSALHSVRLAAPPGRQVREITRNGDRWQEGGPSSGTSWSRRKSSSFSLSVLSSLTSDPELFVVLSSALAPAVRLFSVVSIAFCLHLLSTLTAYLLSTLTVCTFCLHLLLTFYTYCLLTVYTWSSGFVRSMITMIELAEV